MIGTYLKDYMEKNGIKQGFVSEKTGIRSHNLRAMLNEKQKIGIVEYYDICAALGTNPVEMAAASGFYAVANQK